MRRGGGLLAACILAACAPQPPAASAALRLTSSVAECALGQPFLITVERTWGEGGEPAPWDAQSLQPLSLELLKQRRASAGGQRREVLSYRAVSFTAGELDFPPHFRLQVHSGLPANDAGELEAPSAPVASPNRTWLALIALPVVLFALARARRRRRRREEATVPPPPGALDRLRALDPQAAEFPSELSAALRDWLAERADVRAPGRLAEEMLAADPGLSPGARERVREIVRRCEEMRYAGLPWESEARRAALTTALAIAEERP